MNNNAKQQLKSGSPVLGIELGSTRIKAVLIGEDHAPLASGSFEWENRLENGIWTYHLKDVLTGLQSAYADLAAKVLQQYGEPLKTVGAIGISAMMHGYLVFDRDKRLLTPFRTWRNVMTGQAAEQLTRLFDFNIPLRWSVAHLYQSILKEEPHVHQVDFMTTLSGYVHWHLTDKKVLGIGDASGVFPIDSNTGSYDAGMLQKFNTLCSKYGIDWKLENILPRVLRAGEDAGVLTETGAQLLDPTGTLRVGIPLCPPEGDAGTGMAATDSVAERTGNVSAGTSIFAMVVLEKPLSKVYPEIDMVTTPSGKPVAMVHCNNCTSDLDAWVRVFGDLLRSVHAEVPRHVLYDAVYREALAGEDDCGGVLCYNYVSGEPITGLEEGRPIVVRNPDTHFTLGNFMRATLFSAMASLRLGMDILTEKEQVKLEQLLGHGGLFKTEGVGQQLMAAALNVPVTVMESAGEGGAWGIALLAAYHVFRNDTESLEEYLSDRVFANYSGCRAEPKEKAVCGFADYMKRYIAGLAVEKTAVETL